MAAMIKGDGSMTLTVLGCGILGTAILTGILNSLECRPEDINIKKLGLTKTFITGTLTPLLSRDSNEGYLLDKPTRFTACVRTAESAARIESEVAGSSTPVAVFHGENVRAVKEADIIVLGCLPHQLRECIGESVMREALYGKLLISLLAGVTVNEIEEIVYQGLSNSEINNRHRCRIVRAMPNTASCTRESMTVITTQYADPQTLRLVNWLFGNIGEVAHISPEAFDACTALCGSGPAFFSLFLEAMVDATVSLGVKRLEAQILAAHTMRGTSGMILSGEHPAVVREKVATPGGSTMVGLLKLEEGRARSAIASALIECAEAARGAGKKK